jgi:hypothetical protein
MSKNTAQGVGQEEPNSGRARPMSRPADRGPCGGIGGVLTADAPLGTSRHFHVPAFAGVRLTHVRAVGTVLLTTLRQIRIRPPPEAFDSWSGINCIAKVVTVGQCSRRLNPH